MSGSFYVSATIGRESPTASSERELLGAGLHDAFVAQLAPDGSVLWARAFGGTGDDRGSGVAVDEGSGSRPGVVYVSGRFTGEPGPPAVGGGGAGGGIRFGDAVFLSPATGAGDDVFMAQLRLSDGVANWAVAARGATSIPNLLDEFREEGVAVGADTFSPLGGAFFVGKVLGDAQFGVGGTAATRDTAGAGRLDGFACRVTHQGAVDWVGTSRDCPPCHSTHLKPSFI